ncbi:translation initiation factor sui1 [Babesia ovis]|uniref:Translation initiation factor sui1 n=1 Tax=Babesia ovis TaxID=5869 RepID=A0A9W5WV98_BABOV|nr:translation initiation factor sui1 [Babesia ovis]
MMESRSGTSSNLASHLETNLALGTVGMGLVSRLSSVVKLRMISRHASGPRDTMELFKRAELGNVCLVGAKDRKLLRSRSEKALSLDAVQTECLFPQKVSMSYAKLQGTRNVVYLLGADPWLVQLQDGRIFPTINALWSVPKLLPALRIPKPVLGFIMRGAHLMVPGVLNWPCDISPGAVAAIVVDGNPYPVAVGIFEGCLDASGQVRTNGRALEVLHYYGDDLWKLTSKPFPVADDISGDITTDVERHEDVPEGDPSVIENTKNEVTHPELIKQMESVVVSNETMQNKETTAAPVEAEDKQPKINVYPVEMVDYALRLCFLQTIHTLVDTQLPMEISALYSEMAACGTKLIATAAFRNMFKEMGRVSPEGGTQLISYKNSSFNKLIKMFQAWAKEGLIVLKEIRGTGTVVNINRSHPTYVQFKLFNLPQPKEPGTQTVEKVKVKRYLAFSSTQRKTLAEKGVQVDKEPMPLEAYKKLIIEHISKEPDVILKYVNDAIQYHQVSRGDDLSPIRKGPAVPVTVTVEPRGNRKHVTTVKGLFMYLFNVDEATVAETLRRKFASSVSVSNGICTIQGNVAIEKELIQQFGMSQQQIKVTRRG